MSYTTADTQPPTINMTPPTVICDPNHKPQPGSTNFAADTPVVSVSVPTCNGVPVVQPMTRAGFTVSDDSVPAIHITAPVPTLTKFSGAAGGEPKTNYSANIETFANNDEPYFLFAKDYVGAEDWYKFPCLPIAPSTDGIITMVDASGANKLQSIDGNLYFNSNLLAQAGDIQDIGDWALYPALANINASNNDITAVNKITAVDFVGGDVSANTVLCASVATTSVVSDTIAANSIVGVQIDGDLSGNIVKTVDLVATTVTATDVSAGTVTATQFNGGDVSAGTVSATQFIGDLSANQINATDISAGTVTATQFIGDLSANLVKATDVSAGTVTATNFVGSDLSCNSIHAISGSFVGDISAMASFVATGYSQTLDLSNGAVILSTSGSSLLVNGQPVSTGGGGDVSQWATFPAVAPVLSTGTLTLGDGSEGMEVYMDGVDIQAGSFCDIQADRLIATDPARIRLNALNGTGGIIELKAEPDITDNVGGLIDITAQSAGSVSPLALSRVNMEAATLTLSAGALGSLAFVPGSVNLLSGLGTGIQLLTSTGVINIASGVAATMSAGAGIFLDGGTQGVNVAAGQPLYVDVIRPRTTGSPVGVTIDNTLTTSIINIDGIAPPTRQNLFSIDGTRFFSTNNALVTQAIAYLTDGRGSYDFYVAPNGNDTSGTGSILAPYATVGKALTVAAGVASNIEVSINLLAGTYTENITINRPNTYITSYATSGARQPTNIVGDITVSITTATTFSNGFTGLTITGGIVLSTNTTPDVNGVYTFTDCLINGVLGSPTLTFFEAESTSHTLIIENCRFNTGNAASADVGFLLTGGATQILGCIIQHSGDGACISSNDNNNLVIRNSTITSATISATAAPIVQYNNAVNFTTEITFSTLRYSSGVTDTGGNKCCLQFNNAGTATATLSQLFLNCTGATTGTPNIQVVQKSGAGAVNLSYGNLECVGAARFLAPAITETPTAPTPQGRYANYSSSTTQTVTAANTVTPITMNTIEETTGGYTLSGASITVSRAGLYEFIPSFQFHKSGGGATDIFFWAQTSPDGVTWTDVPRSSSTVELAGPSAPVLGTLALMLSLDANERIRFVFASSDATAQVLATAAITSPYVRPANPSVILTIKLLS